MGIFEKYTEAKEASEASKENLESKETIVESTTEIEQKQEQPKHDVPTTEQKEEKVVEKAEPVVNEIDQVKEAIKKNAPQIEEEPEDTSNEDFKKELETYMSDPILKELLELKKKGKSITKELLKEGFEDFDSVDLNNVNTAKHWAKQSLLASGLSEREAEITLKRQFKLIGALDDDLTEEEIEDKEYQELQLKKTAMEFLQKKKEDQLRLKDIDTTSTNKGDVEKEVEKFMTDLTQKNAQIMKNVATNVTERVTKVDYEAVYKDEDGNEVKVPYQVEITADMKKQARKELQDPAFFNFAIRSVKQGVSLEEQEKQLMSTAVKLLFPELNDQLRLSKAVNAAQKKWYDNDLTHRSKTTQTGSAIRDIPNNIGNSKFAKAYAEAAANNS